MYNGHLDKIFREFHCTYDDTIHWMKTSARLYFQGRSLTPGMKVKVAPCKRHVIEFMRFEYTQWKYGGNFFKYTPTDEKKFKTVISYLDDELTRICEEEIAKQPGLEVFQSEEYLETVHIIESFCEQNQIDFRVEAQNNRLKVLFMVQNNKDIVFYLNYKDRENQGYVNHILESVSKFRSVVLKFGHELEIK